MKHNSFFKRLLCMVLVVAILAGYALPANAVHIHTSNGTSVHFTKVDNDEVSAGLIPNGRTEISEEAPYSDTDVVRVSIVLSRNSTIDAGYSAMDITSNQSAIKYRDSLKKDQENMVHKIERTIGADLDVVWNLTLAANIISANVPYGQIKTIEKMAGVKSVVLENQYVPCQTTDGTLQPNMATSGGQIGTSPVWEAGYTGAGMRIAIIDTGIDTDHQSLNPLGFVYALEQLAEKAGMSKEAYIKSLDLLDAQKIADVADKLNVKIDPEQAFVNSKIAFAYNYRDFDYDVTHDNDDQGDHGSHVSGIAAANSWLYNSATGNYGKALDYAFMQGVAPEAQLLSMKVFGKGGSPYDSDFFAAIEDAIVLGADTINLSLGSTAPGRGHHTNDQFQQIMDSLTKSGVVVSISAGNSGAWSENAANGGYLYNTDVSNDTVGQPGAFTNSMAVASVENDGMVGYYFTVAGNVIVYIEELFNDMKSLTTLAGEQEYIFIDGVGDQDDWDALKDVLPGKIAICSRGEINFTEKARMAVEAGAIAVMIYNNVSGIIYLDMSEFAGTAPVVSLTKIQGAIIRENSEPVYDAQGNLLYMTGKMNISDTIGKGVFSSEYYTMSDFSSWGVPGSLEMKPEITAPGGNIFSLEGLNPNGGAYAIKSGTSMAAPQVAGMAALLMQYIRANKLDEKTGVDIRHLTQSLLMSTATPVLSAKDSYASVLQQGAGLANIHDAISADSFITMAPGSSSGAADGKVKVELFDDPDRTGTYSATFTVNNLLNVEKILDLNADFFIQTPISDGQHLYMDTTTTLIGMDLVWYVDGQVVTPANLVGMDFNGDGSVTAADGQTLLDYVTGTVATLHNKEKADVDGDSDIDSHDAYVFLRDLSGISATLPADGSVEIRVDFAMTDELKAMLDETYPNGTYLQGYLFAETDATAHSIPVLGFYGNWTDPSMFDVGSWPTYETEEDTRIPYTGILRGNDFQVRYAKDPNYHYSLGGNPLVTDDVFMADRVAINSADTIHGVRFTPIRHADQSRVVVKNETTGEVILDQKTGPVNMAYFPNEVLGWQNAMMSLETNLSLKNASEGDVITMSFTLVPEYYIDAKGNVDWDTLGDGATMSMSMVVDNTAPDLKSVSVDLVNNTMTIVASDNQYVAAAGLYNKTGTRSLAVVGAKQDIEKGATAEYTFSLDGINGKKFLVQVHDYAMNTATYLIEMQIGEDAGIPDMMAYDLVQQHWTTFTKDFAYDYKSGTPRLEYADHVFYAATIAEHYVFASTSKGELYVMPEDDLSDTTFVVDMGIVLYDMAYNKADGNIYAVTEANNLVIIDKLSGEVTKVATLPKKTNTLACSPEGVFYYNELGTGKIWACTLNTLEQPTLLMEDPFLTREDPIYGDHNGTTGNMGMEYDPNRNMICWNSHMEVLIGSYITFAYYYEIDPATGAFTRYNDFWHEMSCLMIPDETGRNNGWADPTDKIAGVSLNKNTVEVIKGTSTKLTPNVRPWTAINRNVTWSSADPSIATVDENGVITGVRPGTTTITAASQLDPSKKATCEVTVKLLEVTVNGTVVDEDNNAMLYSWNMATQNTWTPGHKLPVAGTSATYSPALQAYYIMDYTDALKMHRVSATGELLASADNENGIPLWDMAYSETFSAPGAEKVTSIYYSYLLSAKDPMALDAVGFDLGAMCSYLIGLTSFGSEVVEDEEGNEYATEHLVMLDNDGYVWDFWVYPREGGGFDALYSITKSDLNLELPGYDNMEHMFTSLMAGEDGNLYLSAFTGDTNEIYFLRYDEGEEKYAAVKVGEMGTDVWPATITSVTVNGGTAANAAPKPEYTMSATTISREELAAASSRVRFTVTEAEKEHKLGSTYVTHAAGTEEDPAPFVTGDNTVTAPKTGYFFTYTAEQDGTATITSEGTDWRATVYINGELSGNSIHNPKYDDSTITRELAAGDKLVFKIIPYSGWSAVEREITVNFGFAPEGGAATDPTEPEVTEPEVTEPEVTEPEVTEPEVTEPEVTEPEVTEPEVTEPVVPENALVAGENALTSGKVYTYIATEDCSVTFEFSGLKGSDGKIFYDYEYKKALRLKIMVNGKHVESLYDNTKVSLAEGSSVTVELVPVNEESYSATLELTVSEPPTKLVLGDNAIAKEQDYSFIADRDDTLYVTVKELWCDGTYCSAASLQSSVVFRVNGETITSFENTYAVQAGDEITVLLGTSFDVSASAVLYLSYEGFYKHPEGSRGNPYILYYADCPTMSVEIPADTAVWYKLSGFPEEAYLTIEGAYAYAIVGGSTVDAYNGKLTVPAYYSMQIGNAGSTAASFKLSVSVTEGTAGNPKDLSEGDNTVILGKSENYYYDFVAKKPGTATITVSGDNWRFWLSHLSADGSFIIEEEDHRAARDDAATVTVQLTVGQSLVVKLGTMDSSWTAPGGEVTVTFHFTPDGGSDQCDHVAGTPVTENKVDATCTADGGYDTVTYCTLCGEELSRVHTTVSATGHIGGPEATCTTAQVCTVCGVVVTPHLGHEFVDGSCSRCGAAESAQSLVLGENKLTSGNVYTYIVPADGRLEFDFKVKDSNGTAVYQYAYSKGTRLKIMINGKYVPNLENTRVSVTAGQTVTVEMVSIDGGNYTATLTLAEIEPATKLQLGDNEIVKGTDYSFIATQSGTLYTTIKELWYDGTYCTETSLSSTVVFKINGVAVSQFRNGYDVQAGDEITVSLGLSFGSESAKAVLHLSYSGFYEHPAGSRGNPYILNFADCPTDSAQIPAGETVWYRLSGFGSGYYLTVTGENAYVIVGNKQYNAVDGVVTIPAATNIQIGNAGTADATFRLTARITEGYPDNPKDLAEGDNNVTLPERGNYWYDFTAPTAGTVTFTVSGENWGYLYTVYGADGTAIGGVEEMQYQYKGNSGTVEVQLSAGQYIVVKLGTMDSSWSQPGGQLTVTFHFESDGSEPPVCQHYNEAGAWETDDTYHWQICDACGEIFNKGFHSYGDDDQCVCGKPDPAATCEHTYGEWTDGKKVCSKCGNTVTCQHPTTTVKNQKAPTCTEDGYTGDAYCDTCGTMTRQGKISLATGHNYQEGICGYCGQKDPDYRPMITHEITADKLMTNGVVTITWDPSKMVLEDLFVNADHYSLLMGEGTLTVGYVSLEGIPAGDAVLMLYFSVVDPEDADVTVKHHQINNEMPGECIHTAVGTPVTENKVDATCTAEGSYDTVIYCAACGIEVSRVTTVVPATGHSHSAVVTAPTCTAGGYTTHTCACGDSYVDNHVDALGHSFTNYVSNNDATTEADGTKTAKCDHGCGAEDTVIDEGSKKQPAAITSDVFTVSDAYISKLPAGTTAAQLLAGIHEKEQIKIFRGDQEITGDTLVGTGMTVKLMHGDTVIMTRTVVVTGDTNGDGKITVTDMLAVKAHVLNKNTLTGASAQAADINADSGISITDFIQIKAAILGKGTVTPH